MQDKNTLESLLEGAGGGAVLGGAGGGALGGAAGAGMGGLEGLMWGLYGNADPKHKISALQKFLLMARQSGAKGLSGLAKGGAVGAGVGGLAGLIGSAME